MKYQHGMALVSILWILLLLMLISSIYLLQIGMEAKLIKAHQKTLQAASLAQSGIWIGLAQLLQNPQAFSSEKLLFDDASLTITAEDEAMKIDLNAASAAAIEQGLLQSGLDLQQASQLTAQIIDWRDTDHTQTVNGMEDPDYLAAGFDYAAKDGPFNARSELILLPAVTPSIYSRIEKHFTVYSQHADSRTATSADSGRVFTVVSHARQDASQARIAAVMVLNPDDTRLYQILSWRESPGVN